MTPNPNPLQMFFRTAALHLRLPSGGKHWPPGTLDLPPTGELPVMPMTAVDEIAYRTPDALFNGSALVSVIQSCCPNIKNAWAAPGIDISAILIAIRLASYGADLEMSSVCPSCGTEGDYTLDLQDAMTRLQVPDYNQSISHGDLEIYFKPVPYETQNAINIKQFEQQRIIMQVQQSDMTDEDKNTRLNQVIQDIAKITVDILVANITAIKTPQTLVTESEFIREFIENCDRKIFNQIRTHAVQLRETSELPPLNVKCNNCQHEYQQPVILDSTNFFESAS